MATETSEIIEYPIVKYDDLTIDPLYDDLRQQGPIRIQLPFGLGPLAAANMFCLSSVVSGW